MPPGRNYPLQASRVPGGLAETVIDSVGVGEIMCICNKFQSGADAGQDLVILNYCFKEARTIF